ncbi:MAG: ferrous iron transport protein B [Desulfovibrionaceae bacterium]|jgi:ferrous iron transport protein B|nr:ferrous iron transport protein B [Desulfovibrionaceae bacterium]
MKQEITIALAGNPNSGKTTLFNAITGAHQHVGNYPGITVEHKEGRAVMGERTFRVVDLPGTYSLTAYTQEELVARKFLAEERPDCVVHVLNAGALERNLYLTVQLLELGVPVALGLNMMDEAEREGMIIDVPRLEELLGSPAAATVARTGRGLETLMVKAGELADARRDERWKPLSISYGPDLDPVLAAMAAKIETGGMLTERYPARWTALKYLENDESVLTRGRNADGALSLELEAMAAQVAEHLQATLNTYPEAVIADYRYGFISSVLKQGVLSRDTHAERIAFSDRLDRVLTHRFLGPILMLLVLYAVYQVTFTLGEVPMGWMESFFGWLGDTATAILPEGLLQSLIVSGIIDGVGGVMGFVPLIMIIFLMIAFLEDSGYMARVAYMLDRVFRIFGLHGCSVMPLIISGGISGGCAVPGIYAARTLRSRREKLATLLTAPYMNCGAKLPVFILLVAAFFSEDKTQALFLITLGAWTAALLVARLLRSTIIRGPSTPFVMELPPYRLPTARGLAIHTWERTWQYIKKAGTVILAISVLLWAAMTFPGMTEEKAAAFDARTAEIAAQLDAARAANNEAEIASLQEMAERVEFTRAEETLRDSYAGRMGIALESVSRAAGFDWRTNIALIGGFAAKEVIVSTLGTAYSLGDVDPEESGALSDRIAADPHWSARTAVSMILFTMLYAPCFVSVVAIRHETGSWGWALFSMGFNTVLAFTMATLAYQIGALV